MSQGVAAGAIDLEARARWGPPSDVIAALLRTAWDAKAEWGAPCGGGSPGGCSSPGVSALVEDWSDDHIAAHPWAAAVAAEQAMAAHRHTVGNRLATRLLAARGSPARGAGEPVDACALFTLQRAQVMALRPNCHPADRPALADLVGPSDDPVVHLLSTSLGAVQAALQGHQEAAHDLLCTAQRVGEAPPRAVTEARDEGGDYMARGAAMTLYLAETVLHVPDARPLLLPHRRQARELANSALGRAMRSAEHDEGRRFRLLAPTRTALTPRQLEVAQRAADGQTNRQIARALGVSERTVHHHVAAVLTALDVPSRAAIGGALAQSVPHPDHAVLARLTPTEHRVAELAATGRTTRGIGIALGMSDRTVEKHLRAALTRIGVPSRAALVSRLGPPPWPCPA